VSTNQAIKTIYVTLISFATGYYVVKYNNYIKDYAVKTFSRIGRQEFKLFSSSFCQLFLVFMCKKYFFRLDFMYLLETDDTVFI